jgi:uncharacterized membrane protein
MDANQDRKNLRHVYKTALFRPFTVVLLLVFVGCAFIGQNLGHKFECDNPLRFWVGYGGFAVGYLVFMLGLAHKVNRLISKHK